MNEWNVKILTDDGDVEHRGVRAENEVEAGRIAESHGSGGDAALKVTKGI